MNTIFSCSSRSLVFVSLGQREHLLKKVSSGARARLFSRSRAGAGGLFEVKQEANKCKKRLKRQSRHDFLLVDVMVRYWGIQFEKV